MKYCMFFITVILLAGCGQQGKPVAKQSDIDSICQKWVPVSSESLCNVKLIMLSDKSLIIKGETNLPEAKSDLLGYLENKGIKYSDSLTVLPDASVGIKKWGLVTVSVCNVRSDPSHSAEMISQCLMGTPVKILKNNGGWYLIQSPDSYIGWTDDDAISLLTDEEIENWKKSDRVIYTGKEGDILDGLKSDQEVSDIVFGAILCKTGQGLINYDVILPDGRSGVIKRSDATDFKKWASRPQAKAVDLIAFAREQLGTPYLWGGTSTKGLDCSGFARTIYFSGGTILTRDASSQFLYGKEVDITASLDSLRPGDLLFFGRIRDGKKSITHVGMYIGNKEFIHESGMVKLNSFDPAAENYNEHLKVILQGARRFLGETPDKGSKRVGEHNWYF
jgi:gamma-D-glutamyl-L-lysine dipeptidyl-peptidase